MKLLNGIFYQYYWAKFPKGFDYRLYQEPVGIAVVIAMLFCCATMQFISIILRRLSFIYNTKLLFIKLLCHIMWS